MARERSIAGGAPRFHCDVRFNIGRRGTLPEEVFHHAVRVRRLRVGDEIVLFAGDGSETLARVVQVKRDGADVEAIAVDAVDRESPLEVTLMQGISSGDRMDYTLQKAVELGVRTIVPVLTERSIVRLAGDRVDKRNAHWREVVISACEQCGRNRIPEVLPAVALNEAMARAETRASDAE